MADTLRELVVSLSLESSHFSRNMRTINNQIKEIESEFRAASAGTSIFQTSVERLNAQLDMESRKLTEQERAVTQYGRALEAARQKLQQDAEYLKQYSERHMRLEEQMRTEIDVWGDLTQCVDAHRTAYETLREAYGEDDARTQQAKAELEYYEQFNDALKLTEGQVASLKKELQNDEDAVSKFSAGLNDAKGAVRDTEKRIEDLNKELTEEERQLKIASSAWTSFGRAMQAASDKLRSVSQTAQTVGRTLNRYVTTAITGLATAAVTASISFESSFANVRKTVDATEERFEELMDSSKKMSTELATGTSEINEVMATAGQLGVPTEQIEEFTEIMIKLGVACEDLDADEAATTTAKFMNVMGTSYDDVDRLGATLVDLGNNFATTEAPILEMAQRMAGAGKIVGLTEAQVLGFATALSSVGIEAQMGGSAFSKALVKMEVAAVEGGEELEQFAAISGMTAKEFQTVWENDPAAAFQAFIIGLAQMDDEGISAISVLNEIGISEIRLRDTLLRTVNASELMTRAQDTANAAWESGTALNVEFDKKMQTTAAQMSNLKNSAMLLAQTVGDDLNPMIRSMIERAGEFVERLMELDSAERMQIIKIAALAAAAGPLLIVFSKVLKGMSFVTSGLSAFSVAVANAGGGIKGLGSVLASSPAFWMALAAAIAYATYKIMDYVTGAKAAREAMEDFDKTAREWGNDVQSAFEKSSGLSSFNVSKDVFGLGGTGKETEEWLDNLITVWTDGKAETNKIIDDIVKGWKDGEEELRTVADESDNAELDAIDKEIEKLLYRYQNGQWNENFEKQLQDLIARRGEIEIKYHLSGDMESGFDDIVTGVEARLRRGDEMSEVFEDAFAAATEGYGTYLSNLDAGYDARYKHLKEVNAEEKEFAKLDKWYNDQRATANKEYAETMTEIGEKNAYLFVGEDGQYKMTQKKLEGIIALTKEYLDAEDATTRNNRKADLLTALGDMDEQEILDYKAAVDALMQSYEETGEEAPTYLKEAQKTLDSIIAITTGTYDAFADKDLSDKIKEMFGGLDEEENEIYAHFNIDSLETSFNTWAADYDHEINADATVGSVTDDGIDKSNVTISSIDGMTGTVSYLKDGEFVTTDIKALEGQTLTITEVTDDGIKQRNIKIHSVDDLTGKVSVIEEDTMTLLDINSLKNLTGTMTTVTVPDDFVPPEIEVKGKLNFEEDGYTTDADANIGFNSARTKTTKNTKGLWPSVVDYFGADYSIFGNLRDVLRGGNDLGPYNWFDLEPSLSKGNGAEYLNLAQYIADGMELIREGMMSDDEIATFIENIRVIKEMLNLDQDTSDSFDQGLAEKLGLLGWDVTAENVEGVIDNAIKTLLGDEWLSKLYNQHTQFMVDKMLGSPLGTKTRNHQGDREADEYASDLITTINDAVAAAAEDPSNVDPKLGEYILRALGLMESEDLSDDIYSELEGAINGAVALCENDEFGADISAAIAGSMAGYGWATTAETVANDIEDALRLAADSKSPAKKYIPVGEDYAAGVGEGMEQYDATTPATTLMNNIKSALNSNTGSQYVTVGTRITQGMVRGIQQGQSAVVQAIIDMTKKAVDAAKKQLGIQSPSKVFRDEIGANLMKGIGEGVTMEAGAQGKIVANAARYLTEKAAGALGGGHSSLAGNDVTTNNNVSSNITVNVSGSWSVRSDNDIRKLAAQIARLTQRVNGGYGMLSQLKAVKP